jgi:hypothetical protein
MSNSRKTTIGLSLLEGENVSLTFKSNSSDDAHFQFALLYNPYIFSMLNKDMYPWMKGTLTHLPGRTEPETKTCTLNHGKGETK